MKRTVYVIACVLVLAGCASMSQPPAVPTCPKPAPVPAWILEPEPDLIPTLNLLISPSAMGSIGFKPN